MEFKLSGKKALVPAASLCGVAVAAVGLLYMQQVTRQNTLKTSLAQTEAKLAASGQQVYAAQQQDLNARIAEAAKSVADLEAKFTPNVSSIPVVDTLIARAEQGGLTVVEVDSTGMSTEDLSTLPVSIQNVKLVVTGELENARKFIVGVSAEYPSCSVTGAKAQIGDDGAWRVTITMNIYSYEGD